MPKRSAFWVGPSGANFSKNTAKIPRTRRRVPYDFLAGKTYLGKQRSSLRLAVNEQYWATLAEISFNISKLAIPILTTNHALNSSKNVNSRLYSIKIKAKTLIAIYLSQGRLNPCKSLLYLK